MNFKSTFTIGLVSVSMLMASCGETKQDTTVENDQSVEKTSADLDKETPIISKTGGTKIGWVNDEVLSNEYELALKLKKNLEEQQLTAQETLQNLEAKFYKKQAALEKEAPILGQMELQMKYEELQKLQEEILVQQQQLQSNLANSEYAATTSYLELTNEFIQEIGKELGYDYIMGFTLGGQVLYASPQHDITKEVVSRLNTAYADHGSE